MQNMYISLENKSSILCYSYFKLISLNSVFTQTYFTKNSLSLKLTKKHENTSTFKVQVRPLLHLLDLFVNGTERSISTDFFYLRGKHSKYSKYSKERKETLIFLPDAFINTIDHNSVGKTQKGKVTINFFLRSEFFFQRLLLLYSLLMTFYSHFLPHLTEQGLSISVVLRRLQFHKKVVKESWTDQDFFNHEIMHLEVLKHILALVT